ncbi:MAG: T9SS type A sorting domain-containing protein [Cytophagales bacterium]|nr:T9SS type A sorting domain-containing protein [Cytophagales bacterium]
MNNHLFFWRSGLLLALLLIGSALRAQNVNWNVVASGTHWASATDATGSVWVAGMSYYPAYEDITDIYDQGYAITKYNASGGVEWTKQGNTTTPAGIVQLEADGAGNVYMLGELKENAEKTNYIDNTVLNWDKGNVFIAKLDPAGQVLWVSQVKGLPPNWRNLRMDIDAGGNVYLLGEAGMVNPITFGGITLPGAPTQHDNSCAGSNKFLAKCSSSGAWQWARLLTVVFPFYSGAKLAVTPAGDVYVAGAFYEAAYFRNGADTVRLTEYDPENGGRKEGLFYAKYNTAGAFQWVKKATILGWPYTVSGIDADNDGNLHLAGTFGTAIGFGGVNLSEQVSGPAVQQHLYYVKVNGSGNTLWAKSVTVSPTSPVPDPSVGTPLTVEPLDVSVDPAGNIYLAGGLNGAANFGGSSLSGTFSAPTTYVVKYNATWQLQWVKGNVVPISGLPVSMHYNCLPLFPSYKLVSNAGAAYLATTSRVPLNAARNIDNYSLLKLSSQSVTTNLAPAVSAGSDQTVAFRGVNATHTVVSGSTRDPDGTIKSVAWTKKSGPAAFMTGTKTPTLVVSELSAGAYVFAMSATDSKNITSADEVKVVVGSTAAQTVSSFSLINADTDQPIKTLVNGETINLAALPTKNLNILANTNPATVGSVRFVLNGVAKNESIKPYAWAGDNNGNYNAWTPAAGNYTLSGTAYSGAGATGTKGGTLTLNFTITNQPGPSVASITLVNADTDANIRTLTTGSTIDMNALPTKRINLRAYTNPATVGSVRMVLNGTTRTENIAPYAWAGDNNGNLNPWTPPNGNYTLTVTAYSGTNGTGLAGKPVQVSFKVINSSAAARLATGAPGEIGLKVYPNPATDQLHLQLAETAEPVQVQLYDPLGRLHYQGRLQGADGNRVVDLTGLAPGLYVVQVESGGRTYRVKVRKEK